MTSSGEQHIDVSERGADLPGAAGDGRLQLVPVPGPALLANSGVPLNVDWIDSVRINTSAVERRAATLTTRRTVKKDWQVAWLLRAITCMDLTTLSGDDTAERVRRLCAKARRPVSESVKAGLGIEELQIQVAAVCVYHLFIETARRALEGTSIRVAAVSAGFPAGLNPLPERMAEIRRSVEMGADEIDVVITRAHVFAGDWPRLYDEVASFKEACGRVHCKVILGTGDLGTLRNVAQGPATLLPLQAQAVGNADTWCIQFCSQASTIVDTQRVGCPASAIVVPHPNAVRANRLAGARQRAVGLVLRGG